MLGQYNFYREQSIDKDQHPIGYFIEKHLKPWLIKYFGVSLGLKISECLVLLVRTRYIAGGFIFFATKKLLKVLPQAPIHYLLPGIGATFLIESSTNIFELSWAKNKNIDLIGKTMVGIFATLLIVVAAIGILAAAGTFALVAPILLTIATAFLAFYDFAKFSYNFALFLSNLWPNGRNEPEQKVNRNQYLKAMLLHGSRGVAFATVSIATGVFMIAHVTSIPLVVASEILIVAPLLITYSMIAWNLVGRRIFNYFRNRDIKQTKLAKLNHHLRAQAHEHAQTHGLNHYLAADKGVLKSAPIKPRVDFSIQPSFLETLSDDHTAQFRGKSCFAPSLPVNRAEYVEGLARNTVGDLTYSGLLAAKEYLLLQLHDKLDVLKEKCRRLREHKGVFISVQKYFELDKIEKKITLLEKIIPLLHGKRIKISENYKFSTRIFKAIRRLDSDDDVGIKDINVETQSLNKLELDMNRGFRSFTNANQSLFKYEGDVASLVRAAKKLMELIQEAVDEGIDLTAKETEYHSLIASGFTENSGCKRRSGFRYALASVAA